MIIAGFGFRSTTTLESLLDAYRLAGSPEVRGIATSADKCGTEVFQQLGAHLNLPRLAILRIELEAAEPFTQSPASQKYRKTGSLAEAAALAAIGYGAQLLAPRFISQDRMATCAIAQGTNT